MLPGEREMQAMHRARRDGVRVAASDLAKVEALAAAG
jgi:LDH2 family malate/lactate/ureidoglycolate dehydrogenase